jgi:hypothetical protein
VELISTAKETLNKFSKLLNLSNEVLNELEIVLNKVNAQISIL